jgi:hypothetical protein
MINATKWWRVATLTSVVYAALNIVRVSDFIEMEHSVNNGRFYQTPGNVLFEPMGSYVGTRVCVVEPAPNLTDQVPFTWHLQVHMDHVLFLF